MPTYNFRCLSCDNVTEAFRKMANMHHTPLCKECGGSTKKIMSVCNIGAFSTKVMDAFESPSSGKIITSEREKIEDMKRTDCRPWEGLVQEKKETARKRKHNDEKLDKAVETSLNKQVAQMDSKKRKILNL